MRDALRSEAQVQHMFSTILWRGRRGIWSPVRPRAAAFLGTAAAGGASRGGYRNWPYRCGNRQCNRTIRPTDWSGYFPRGPVR